MKKLKKIISVMLAMAMVFAMSATTFAATTTPSATDTSTVQVCDVEAGVTVKAYHIIYATYSSTGNGLTGYEYANSGVESIFGTNGDTMEAPSADTITEIAYDIFNGSKTYAINLIAQSDTTTLTYNTSGTYKGMYTANLTAGMWLILVWDSGATVYNPMIVSNWYTDANDASSLTTGSVSANDYFIEGEWDSSTGNMEDYVYEADENGYIYAKSSTISVDKEITNSTYASSAEYGNSDGTSANIGDSVYFTIETQFPDYSDTYKDCATFIITDTLSTGLTYNYDITVYVGGSSVTAKSSTYTLTASSNSIKIDFDTDYILENGAKSILITYSATINTNAVVTGDDTVGLNTNTAAIEYSNQPNSTFSSDDDGSSDIVYVYTFGLTDEVVKVTSDATVSASGNDVTISTDTSGNSYAISGAEFTIYTDSSCTTVYTNTYNTTGVYTTDSTGCIVFSGLSEGTYYITETSAPTGYMINDTVYKIEISAEYSEAEDASYGMITEYTITVSELDEDNSTVVSSNENTYQVTNTVSENSYTLDGDSSSTTYYYTYTYVANVSVSASQNPTAIVDPDIIKLPSTGGIGLYVIIALSVAIFGGCAIVITRRKKSEI